MSSCAQALHLALHFSSHGGVEKQNFGGFPVALEGRARGGWVEKLALHNHSVFSSSFLPHRFLKVSLTVAKA